MGNSKTPSDASSFWEWFLRSSKAIANALNDATLIDELDENVRSSWPLLAWEIGPSENSRWYLAISPNLNPDLVKLAQTAIENAPDIPGWDLYAWRQRKLWQGAIEFESQKGPMLLHVEDWSFVLLQFEDGGRELVIVSRDAEALDEDDRWVAAAIVVESLLGERVAIEIGSLLVHDSKIDPKFVPSLRPIRELPLAFNLSNP